jgi:hypothetical protein
VVAVGKAIAIGNSEIVRIIFEVPGIKMRQPTCSNLREYAKTRLTLNGRMPRLEDWKGEIMRIIDNYKGWK